jgi:hypothetical protein
MKNNQNGRTLLFPHDVCLIEIPALPGNFSSVANSIWTDDEVFWEKWINTRAKLVGLCDLPSTFLKRKPLLTGNHGADGCVRKHTVRASFLSISFPTFTEINTITTKRLLKKWNPFTC